VEMLAPPRPTYWRSVGQSINTTQLECAIDEIAVSAGVDPFTYRKRHMGDLPRAQAVLDQLAAAIQWHETPVGSGSGWGISFSNGFGAFAAMAVLIEATDKLCSIQRVVAVVDQGVTVNPDQSEAQMQGGIIDGLAAACLQQITIDAGKVKESSWTDYPTFRIKDIPQIDVHLIPSHAAPGSVSELATPMVMPALLNAIFVATGQRIRTLPLTTAGFRFA
jgi:isoquinoline 1-oxidoreductase beta subunit